MSIVQGVALGFLAVQVTGNWTTFGPTGWLLAITTSMLLILTWNEYVVGIAALDWAPALLDSTIPFLLCAAEIWLAVTISDDAVHWFLAFAFFAGVASLAFCNMYGPAREDPRNQPLLQTLASHHRVAVGMPL